MKYPSHINTLIEQFKKLPGVGQRTAERFAFYVLDWPQAQIDSYAKAIQQIPLEIKHCDRCHAICSKNNCLFCDDSSRSKEILCIVAHSKDVFAIEDALAFNGLFHVLGGLLSPANGFNKERLHLTSLFERLVQNSTQEVILAFDSTIEGDATTLFLKNELQKFPLKISRLAFGMPVGSSLEFIDSSTLSRAFVGRQGF